MAWAAPSFSAACRRASTGDMPARKFSSVCKATCSAISSRRRWSARLPVVKFERRMKKRRRNLMAGPLGFLQDNGMVPVGKQQDICAIFHIQECLLGTSPKSRVQWTPTYTTGKLDEQVQRHGKEPLPSPRRSCSTY